MKKLRIVFPHAAIVAANMYLILFAVDKVNRAMNFIDNGYTRFVLLLLCALGVYDFTRMPKVDKRDKKLNGAVKKSVSIINILLLTATVVVCLIGMFFSRSLLMTNGFVKAMILIAAYVNVFQSVRLISYDRAMALRKAKKRETKK